MPPKRKASQASNADSAIGDSPNAKKNKSSSDGQNAAELEFITHARPVWDFERQYRGGDIPNEEFIAQDKYHLKPLKEHPDWPWAVSQKAWDIYGRYLHEMQKRNQDQWQMHIYEDFTGYGILELMHDLLQRYHDEFSKKKKDPSAIFFRLEGMVLFMTIEEFDMERYLNIDDGECVQMTNTLIIKAFLATLHLLHQKDLIKSDGPLKSFRMCVTSFLHWLEQTDTETFFEDTDEKRHAPAIIAEYCNAHDLDYKLAYKIDNSVESAELPADFTVDQEGEDPYGFKDLFKELRENQHGEGSRKKLGGSHYDLTKWSKRQRLDDMLDPSEGDPMDILGPQLRESEKECKEPYP